MSCLVKLMSTAKSYSFQVCDLARYSERRSERWACDNARKIFSGFGFGESCAHWRERL
jgi:hypothetical protein